MPGSAQLAPQSAPPQHLRLVRPAVRPGGSGVPNAIVGVLIFLATETMLFGGLISTLLVLRANSAAWPPPDQPRLPMALTALNTLILIASGWTVHQGLAAIRRDRQHELSWCLWATGVLGGLFLVVQGAEWIRLIRYGLHVSSGTYGATFYILIGCHGLHVLIGLVLIFAVLWGASRGRYSARNHVPVEVCRLYWTFVVGVWPVLYVLVYLI